MLKTNMVGWHSMAASINGHSKVAETLLKAGADVNVKDIDGNTALKLAASSKSKETMISGFIKLSVYYSFLFTILREAIEYELNEVLNQEEEKHVKTPETNLELNEVLNQEEEKHVKTPKINLVLNKVLNQEEKKYFKDEFALITASEAGDLEAVKALIEAGGAVNASIDGWTALMAASINGHSKVAETLLKAGANVNASMGCWTALKLASINGHSKVAEILLKAGAEILYCFKGE